MKVWTPPVAQSPIPEKPPPPRVAAPPQPKEAAKDRFYEVCRIQQDDIKKAQAMPAAITKGIRAGEPLDALFIQAVKCISYMTGNQVLLTVCQRELDSRKERSINS